MCVTAVFRSCHSNRHADTGQPDAKGDVDRRIVAKRLQLESRVRHCPDKKKTREYEPGLYERPALFCGEYWATLERREA